jgi:hypothetical protein
MVRNKKNRNRKSGSLFDTVDLKSQNPKQMERANNLFKFIQRNPKCTRPDMINIVRWASKDNLLQPLRILMTQERIWAFTGGAAISFSARATNPWEWSQRLEEEGKIEARACQGTKKDGNACRVPSLYIGEDGYCKFHRGQKLQPIPIPVAVADEPWKPATVADEPEPWNTPGVSHTIVINPGQQVVVQAAATPDTYKDIIVAFLDGKATIGDLKKAVE